MKTAPLFVSLFFLSACGFQPLYGTHPTAALETPDAASSLAQIEIDIIPDREGQLLRNELIDRLTPRGAPQSPAYRLTFTGLSVQIRELDLTKNSESTRAQVIASTNIRLIELATGREVLLRPVKSISSYNILPSEFATNVTENNARESALKDLARQVQLQLSLYFNQSR